MKLYISDSNLDEIISKTLAVLKKGGLVVFPSDTVYGLLCDALNEEAVKKLLLFKNRPPGKPISVFVSDFEMMDEYVVVDPDKKKILEKLLPGPFTVVLPSKGKVIKALESEKGSLGVRIPNYPLILRLVKEYGKPITATSANVSGKGPHYTIESLLKTLSDKKKELLSLIVDAGRLPRNKPSTVIDLTGEEIKILRKGDIVLFNTESFITYSDKQTIALGEFLMEKYLKVAKEKGLVFIVEGDLGVGKTQFAKGVGKFLGVEDVISPSFVTYYEYKAEKVEFFYHFDLYAVEEVSELEELKIGSLVGPDKVVLIEWGEKIGQVFEELRKKTFLLYIQMEYRGEKEREIKVSHISK